MTTRNVRPFVHLRVLSSYSLGLGLSSPGEVCRHARRAGFDAVALTDVSGTYGFVELHRAARESGVKPIYGTLVFLDWSVPGHPNEPVQSLILLALDRTGLRNVCSIATISAIRRERREALFASHLDGFTEGVVAIAHVDPKAGGLTVGHLLGPLHDLFGDRLFMECRPGLSDNRLTAQARAIAEATEAGIACVLTQDVRFVGPARPQLFDLMASLDESGFEHRVFSDRRAGDSTPTHAMATASEISAAYEEFPDAYTNASLIASWVQPDLFNALEEPPAVGPAREMFAAPPGGELRARAEALNARDAEGLARDERELAASRVQCELALIEQAGMEQTLFRFERLVGLLRETGARLGPATGLSVQSRCAYLLGITSFDPYSVDARFEPSFQARESWGGVFDLNISPEDRPAVLAIINRAFAGASVGYVPSVEHLTAARSMRMVARWLETPAQEVEEAVKAATRLRGATLRQLAEDNRAFGTLYRRSAAFRELVAHAAPIEGLPFGFTRSKRTVVVSPRSLREFFAHTVSPTTGDHFVQATRDSFPLGAVLRIDLSLLRVLAIVPASGVNEPVDPAAYGLIESGDLEGVHLLEGAPGRLASSFGIRSFDDLVHFVALVRGRERGTPLANRLAEFRGQAQSYPAAAVLGDLLASTNGWVLFRDQLRDIAATLTGWSPAEAAAFLERLADHTPGNLAAVRHEFFKRTVERSVSLEDATAWFTRLVRESGQVLDRQRIIAECLIARRCLGMKWASPEAFARRLAAYADDRRVRYEPPARGHPDASPGEPASESAPEAEWGEAGGLFSDAPRPGGEPQLDLLGGAKTIGETANRPVDGNPAGGFNVLATVSEFYPHPASTPVELAGRIRNLQTFKTSSDKKVGYFELIDSSGSVRIFVPAALFGRSAQWVQEGNDVVVSGTVRLRDRRKVCDALKIEGSQGGSSFGQTSADRSSTRDP